MSTRTGSALLAAACLALASSARAGAAVDVGAELDQDLVGLDQTVTLSVTVTIRGNGSVQRIELPSSPKLRELGTSTSESSSISIGSGGMSVTRSQTYRTSYQPVGQGDVTLPPAVVVVDGQAYRGPPLRLKILPAGQGTPSQPRGRQRAQSPFSFFGMPNPFGQGGDDGEDPFNQMFGGARPPTGQDVFLAAGVDRRRVYLGQELTWTIRLFSRVDVSEFDDVKLPGFDGFWGEELESPTHPMPTIQNVGGVPYQVYLIKKKALFPSRSGKISIGAAEADISAGGLFFRGRRLHRATQPIEVEVLPLPPGAPPGFSTSNVGDWRLSAQLQPAQISVGEPASLTLTVEGSGNLHALVLPKLPAIPGLRVYDPTSTDKASVNGDRFGGIRKSEFVVVAQRTGEFEIPSLELSTFDPQSRSYSTQRTPAFSLRVVPAVGGQGSGAAAGQNVLEASYRPLRPDPALAVGGLPPLPDRALAAILVLPPLALALAWAAERLRRRREELAPLARERRAYRSARKRLKAAKALLEAKEPERALDELTRALVGYLEDRTGGPIAGLAHAELREKLVGLGASEAAARAAVRALEACELRRYAPGARGSSDGHDLLSSTEFALDALERTGLSRRAA